MYTYIIIFLLSIRISIEKIIIKIYHEIVCYGRKYFGMHGLLTTFATYAAIFPPPRAWIGIQFHYYLSISQFHETSPVLHLIYINIYSSNLPSWDSISDLRGFPSLLSPPPPPSPKELATGSGSHSFDEDDPWTEMKKKSSFSNHSQYWCDGK